MFHRHSLDGATPPDIRKGMNSLSAVYSFVNTSIQRWGSMQMSMRKLNSHTILQNSIVVLFAM